MGRPAICRFGLVATVALTPALIGGCSPTATYGTGEAPEVAMFREMTGGLLSRGKEKEPINYQPRAPLVMPPSSGELPPPAEPAEVAAPDWPVDPSQRVASVEEREEDPRYGGSQAEYRRLKPLAGAFPDRPDLEEPSESPYDIVHHNKQRRQQFRSALAEARGVGRSERRYLTDPPNAYRKPATTAPAEFENIQGGGGGGGWLRWLTGRR